MKIKKWDKVEVISWKTKDRWIRAEVLKVIVRKNRVLVKWVNIATKHLKKSWTTPGSIVKIEKTIDISSVMLVCPFTDKPTRVWFINIEEKGKRKKFRFSKKAVKIEWWKPEQFII